MQQWKLTLAYDGTSFNGWQVQPGLPTVQGALAAAIQRITGESVLPQGSGRTDAGVHALSQVASFALAAAIPPSNLRRALNHALPPAIRILSAQHTSPNFHARHSALAKTYEYRIFLNSSGDTPFICPPFLAPYVWDCPWQLSPPRAARAALCALGTHDFTSFAAVDPDRSTREQDSPNQTHHKPYLDPQNLRTMHHSAFTCEDGLLLYRVTGSGFLHHMVRNLVGTFVEIAAGRIPPDAVPHILAARSRSAAGPTAPARGLFLVSVDYPPDPQPGATGLVSAAWEASSQLSQGRP